MSILNNLKKLHAAVVAQRLTNEESPLGVALNNAAVAALTGGINSAAWKSYMAIFADNPDQLERLSVQRQGEAAYLPQLRAYMVSNAICDISTNAFTNNRVTAAIDGVPGTNDPPVSDAANDQGGQIAALRPQDLKVIPDVTI